MLSLFISVCCSVLIANLLMVVGRKGKLSMLPIFLGNYFVASISSYYSLRGSISALPVFDISFGIFTGALFLLNFWVYQKCIVVNGLSLSVGIMRIAMIVPILLALIIFGERLNIYNFLGIVIGLAAFGIKTDTKNLHNLLWILGLFIISGFTDASLKLYKELGSAQEPLFVYLIFSSAFIYTLAAIIIGKTRVSLAAILFGFALGIPNRLSTVFFLRGLDSVPAAIAYPSVAVSIVLLSILSDILFWKKQATRHDLLLWSLLIISLILLNL